MGQTPWPSHVEARENVAPSLLHEAASPQDVSFAG
jgi:hypothetical protein